MTVTIVTPTAAPSGTRRNHGTRAKYVVDKCRCELCRAANREAERVRWRAMHRPDQVWLPYVPADRARQHLANLAERGVGLKTVSKLSGLGHGVLSKLVYGDSRRGQKPSARIRPETERRILAVTVDQAAGHQKIPAGRTWELLDDLIGRGYPRVWLARRITKNPNAKSLQLGKGFVYARTARRVEALHRILGDRPGPGRKNPWETRRARGDQPWRSKTA